MSSDEDEFFDAPNAFLSSNTSKWSDSNEDLSMTALEIVSKNAERRNRVESLRRNVITTQSSVSQQESIKEPLPTKTDESISSGGMLMRDATDIHHRQLFQQQQSGQWKEPCRVDPSQQQPLIQAVLYQQQLINQLQQHDDISLCQCMRHLLSTLGNQPAGNQLEHHQLAFIVPPQNQHPLNHLPPLLDNSIESVTGSALNSSITQSCPECCKPIYSLGNTLGLQNFLSNVKSWSLDTGRISDSEKRRIHSQSSGKEQSRTLPSDMMMYKASVVDSQQAQFQVSHEISQIKCQHCHSAHQEGPTIKYLLPPDNDFSCLTEENQGSSCVCTKQAGPNNTLVVKTGTVPSVPSSSLAVLANTGGDLTAATSGCGSFSRRDSTKQHGAGCKSANATLIAVKDHNSLGFLADTSGPKGASFGTTLSSEMLPPEMNPIEIQFRERTKSNTSLQKSEESERVRDSNVSHRAIQSLGGTVKRLQKNVRIAWSAVSRAKLFNPDEEASSEDEEFVGNRGIRLRSSRRMKGQRDFLQIKLVQEMKDEHTGAIWTMRFSPCGRLLATAGYDRDIRIWVLRQYYWYFKQYQKTAGASTTSNSNNDKVDCDFDLSKQVVINEYDMGGSTCGAGMDSISLASTSISTGKTDGFGGSTCSSGDDDIEQGRRTPFRSRPLIIYRGHEGVITDLVWSKNLFLLATSMDRQVRLWHISRRECLCIFNHNDTVPTVVFHPKDDRYFLSGSLDGKLRLWNIPDKKIRYWVEALLPNSLPSTSVFLPGRFASNTSIPPKTVITTAAFVCEATKIAVGTYDGRVLFYTAELEYITSMAIKSSHGKNRHCRITAIEVDPTDSCKILVTSNDSRVRLIDARDYHITCKYRGFNNFSSQIRASFSPTGKYIISGSENSFFYIWKKDVEVNRMTRFSTTRKDRNNYWEAIKAHETVVSVSAFSPSPHLVLDKRFRRRHSISIGMATGSLTDQQQQQHNLTSNYLGEVIVSADINGVIRVFKNRIHSHPVSVSK